MNPLSKRETYLDKVFNDLKSASNCSSDYMRAYPEQIRPYVSSDYYVLGTDGFGRSDSRQRLREFLKWMQRQSFKPVHMHCINQKS